jgi:predicted Rossmann-fold nucleotide-binding protein
MLFSTRYWEGFLDWLHDTVLAKGFISKEDFDLLRVCDDIDTVVEGVERWHRKQEVIGRKALLEP